MPNILPSRPACAEDLVSPLRPEPTAGDPELPTTDGCPLWSWGCRATTDRPTWRQLSVHVTSAGEVEYCKCSCDAIVMLCHGEVAALTALPREE